MTQGRTRTGSGAALTAVGAVAFNAGQLLVVTLLARRASPVEVGAYALALAIATPVFTFANLSLRSVLVSDPDGFAHFPVYRRVRLATTALGLVVAVGVIQLHPTLGALALLVAVAKALDAVADLYAGALQKRFAFVLPAVSQIVNGLLTPVLVWVLLAPLGTRWALLGSCAASLVALLMLVRGQTGDPGDAPVAAGRLRAADLVRTSLPLGIASSLIAVSGNLPRYFLGSTHGEAELGVFSAVSYVTIAGLTVFSGVAQVLLPSFVVRFRREGVPGLLAVVRRGALVIAGLGVVAMALIALLGRQVLGLLYGPAYARGEMLLVLGLGMVVAAFSWVVDLALTAVRAFRAQLVASVVAVVAGLAVAPWLVGAYGGMGAAWLTLVTYAVHAAARLACLGHAVRSLPAAAHEKEEASCSVR